VLQAFDNDQSDASIKGDIAHALLEEALEWGVVPDHPDVDIMYAVMLAVEYINSTYKDYKSYSKCKLLTEVQLNIPETGEFGTADVVLVTDRLLHIIDYKNGYVPVDINMNAQLMLYLLGAIAEHGERKHYKLTVIQPNYSHKDGMIRHFEPTENDINWFKHEVGLAMASESILAGKHCKTSYCPARGSCSVFNAWAQENLKLAYYPGEPTGMTDEQLGQALEQAEILQGYRDMLRGEAMRRILQQNKTINGYKIVKAKQNRAFASDKARDHVFQNLKELGIQETDLYEKTPIGPAGVERAVKKVFKKHGRGAWMKGMDHVCPDDMLQPQNQSLTLEKSIDGRKEYRRGNEFDTLKTL
jgi:hypothetical protein